MSKINTYEKAFDKIEEIRSHKNVEIATFYNGTDRGWEYYFSLSGWFNGNYFKLYLTGIRDKYEIDIPRGVTDQKTLFKKQFKLY